MNDDEKQKLLEILTGEGPIEDDDFNFALSRCTGVATGTCNRRYELDLLAWHAKDNRNRFNALCQAKHVQR